jgi:hypothetical protein
MLVMTRRSSSPVTLCRTSLLVIGPGHALPARPHTPRGAPVLMVQISAVMRVSHSLTTPSASVDASWVPRTLKVAALQLFWCP